MIRVYRVPFVLGGALYDINEMSLEKFQCIYVKIDVNFVKWYT
jgi:hypothetical protein